MEKKNKCSIGKKQKIVIIYFPILILFVNIKHFLGRSIMQKKGEGSQVKESTDSSTTLEDEDVKGEL